MKLRTLIVTICVLSALSVVVFFVQRPTPPPSTDPRIGQPLVAAGVIEKATKLRISDQGKTVTLVRQPDGTWRVPSYFDLPADFTRISNLIGTLTDAKLERLVTSNAERISRLEFKDTKIELLDSADKEVWSVTLGKNPEAGGGRFVRFGDEQKAFLASLNAYLDTEPKNWANTELLSLKADDIAKIEIPFVATSASESNSTVTLSRAKKDDAWTADKTPAGQKVKADKISTLLSSIGSIRFSDTNEPTDANAVAAKANERRFKLETFDHKVIQVALGRKPEEKKLKPPAATTDGKTGPAALGSITDLAKKDEAPKAGEEKKPEEPKPLAPEYETIPAGPVFVNISNSDGDKAPINTLMTKRAFQVSEYVFTGLPQKADELFEPAPPPAPAPKPEEKKPEETKKP